MRIMGLDYGAKTVGVAISDEMLLTAQPVETIKRERAGKLRQTLARIETLMKEYDVEKVVIGLPKKLNNEEGDRCDKTREFGDMVERRSGLEVVYQDERLTTVAADAVLAEGGVRKENRKEYIDKVAASIILQGYLDSISKDDKE
ncbi:MAG: Holliday junction resolvase RuvX [Lachnospiraceae bacterium]|nr:Holliday junction resolvase RuvX [Lachnospiraceae bacterium]MCI5588405.1 Holliday junction resolvase RuvX [Lachnospiraceae bacterium]